MAYWDIWGHIGTNRTFWGNVSNLSRWNGQIQQDSEAVHQSARLLFKANGLKHMLTLNEILTPVLQRAEEVDSHGFA